MHYKKLRIVITCMMLVTVNLTSTCFSYAAEEAIEASTTETQVETTTESVTESTQSTESEENHSNTSTKQETKKSTKIEIKQTKKEDKKASTDKKSSEEKNTSEEKTSPEKENKKEIDPIRDVLPSGSDNVALTSKNRTDYNMPEEIVHGLTDTSKEKIDSLTEKKKKLKKEIKKNKKKIKKLQLVTKSIETLSIKLVSIPDSVGQDSSIGTLRDIADTQKIPKTNYDQDIQKILTKYSDSELQEWSENYTLDYYVSVGTEREFVTGDTSDVLPVLTKTKQNLDVEISTLLSEIQSLKNQITNIQEQIKQYKVERVFNPNDVTIPSNLTIDEIHEMLEGTNLDQLSETFLECEQKYNINAVFLMSIAAHESNWGNSRRAREDHNYTGYGVFSDSAVGINADNGEDNIRHTAMKLRENYLNEDGKYYNGVRVCDVHKRYCATGGWSQGVCTHAYTLMERIISEPVYETPKDIEEKEKQKEN